MHNNMSASERDTYVLQLIGFDFWLITGIAYTVEIIVAGIVNPMAIYFILTHKVLYRSPTNIFILSASCADLIYELTIAVYVLSPALAMSDSDATPPWLAVRVCVVMFGISMTVSLMNTCCISVERGIATFRPLKYKSWVTPKRVICIVILTWVYMLVMQPVLAIIYFRNAPDYVQHTILPTFQEIYGTATYETYISAHVYLPLVVSVMVYSAIAVKIVKQSKNTATQNNLSRSQKQSLKVTKVTMLLLLLMIVTLLPLSMSNMLLPIPADPTEDPETYRRNKMSFLSCGIPMLSYSFLNIIFYCYNHKDFRAAVVSKLKRNKIDSSGAFTVTDGTGASH